MERTLVLVKPNGVERGLIGEVIGRLERRGHGRQHRLHQLPLWPVERNGNGAHEFEGIEAGIAGHWRSGDRHEIVDRHGLGMRLHAGDGVQHAHAVLNVFTETNDAAAADGDVRLADVLDGLQAIGVGAGGDDLAVGLAQRLQFGEECRAGRAPGPAPARPRG